jgi:autotransporter translocation and assembly factor TamB
LENNLHKNVSIEKIQSVSFHSLILSKLIISDTMDSGENIILLESDNIIINFKFTWPFPSLKNWQLTITQLTFQKAQLNLQRDIKGDFTFLKNLNLQPEMLSSNFTFNKITFEDSSLLFQDDAIQENSKIITEVKDLNGSFNLFKLPKVEFEMNGATKKMDSSIALQGYLFIDKPYYSLNCQLKNVDMMDFKDYINDTELLNLEKGQFDLKLALNMDSNLEPAKISWQGEISFKDIDLRPDVLDGIFIENIHGTIQFKDTEIQIDTLQGLLYNQPFFVNGMLSFQEILNFNLDLKANDVSLSVLMEELKEYVPESNFLADGDISLNMNLQGNLDDFQVKGVINSLLLNLDDWKFKNTNLLFSFKENDLMIDSLKTQWENAQIALEGIIDLKTTTPAYHLSASFNGLDLENSVFENIIIFDSFSGIISGKINVDGALQKNSPISLTGLLTAQEVKLLENPLKEPITAQLEMNVINLFSFKLNRLTLFYLQNQLNIFGKMLTENQLDFQFKGDSILLEDLSFLSNLENLSGNGNITGKIQGSLSQPQIESNLKLESVHWGNNTVDNLEGDISYQFPFLQFNNILLSNNGFQLTADGQVDLQKNTQKQVDLKLQIDRLDMRYLSELLNIEEPLSGWTHGVIDLQGSWPNLSLESQLNMEEFSMSNYYLGNGNILFELIPDSIPPESVSPLEQKLSVDWIKNNYQLTIKELTFKQKEMTINAQGKAVFKGDIPFFLDIDFNHNDLNQFIDMSGFGELKIGNMLPSKIDGNLKITGDLTTQQFLLNSQFSTLEHEADLQHQLRATLEKKGPVITLSELALKQKKGEFSAKGRFNMAQNLSDIEFQAKEFDLQSIAQLIEFKEEVRGKLDISGTFTGSLNQPDISTTVQIEDGYFRDFEFQNLQSKINWKDNQFEIKELIITYQKDFKIIAQGQIPFPFISSEKKLKREQDFSQLPLNFKISLENTDLSFIQLFWDKEFQKVQGITNLVLNLSGTVDQPIINGNLTLNKGSLALSSAPITLDNIEAKIDIVNNLVEIPQMTLLLNNNLINISGDFKLVNFQPDNLRIKIWNEGGNLIYQDILTAQTNFQVEVYGSIDSPKIKGEFIFSKGTLNGIPNFQFDPGKNDSLMFSKVNLDLFVKILNDFQFKAPNIDLKLGGEVKIKGELSQPIFTGQLSVGKGYFVFLEQKFQFTEGKMLINEFTGPDVLLDIKANAKVGQVTVFLIISGNLSSPQVSLSSKPALSEPEILSLLTLNKNILNLSEGEVGELFKEDIINLIFQGLSIGFLKKAEDQIAGYLGLDIFRIETLYNKNLESTSFYDLNFKTTGIEIGKAINEDLFLTYSTSLDGISSRSLGIDYQFKPDLSFNAEINTFELEKNSTEIKFGLQFDF